jgi:hypothetical protein
MLLKHYLTEQQAEELVSKVEGSMSSTVVFNNGWLGQYAINLRKTVEGLGSVQQVNVDDLEDEHDREIFLQLQKDLEEEERRHAEPKWETIIVEDV